MWPFDKKQEVAVQEAPAVQVEAPIPVKKEIVIPPFGAQAHGLTQFGTTWINLDEVSVIEFSPPDGCGCECMFKGASGHDEWHVPIKDAAAIRIYLEGMQQVKRQIDS